ncbi:KaiC-like transcriptional regulator [Halorubrum aidingense JCM 13560]|uniref:KaiC-like transcriptional regulator n=1 Tax=Halorubrum aidingense JCM 13560 TaxID=1230454 RepID=M0PJ10_9EURY|nr:hypothetical protein [Halorubrum aidingense]EMA68750.1 KaiC-like transcriptional regulator [Halorubrum aidingense JCM 13560]
METLPTGISVLDREFGGGLPSGSVVALTADPASQSELILDRFSRVRDCLYLTTVRPADAVEETLTLDTDESDRTDVRGVGDDDSFDEVLDLAADIPDRGTVVVDSVEPLEHRDRAGYRRFLNELRQNAAAADAMVLLHALEGDADAPNRLVTEQIADIVFDLRTTVTGTDIVNRLVVPKFRGGAALEEPLKLKLTDTVSVDTSRDIA